MKKLLAIACFLVALVLVVALAVLYWANASMRQLEHVFRTDVAAERSRAATETRPPLRGAPRDANAADEYRAAIAAIEADEPEEALSEALGSLADGAPAPLPPTVTAYLDRHRPEMDRAREATRATRCDWRTPYEDGAAYLSPAGLGARTLARLMIAAGHERALAGDARGAAERYLEVVRFGADLGANATLIERLFGLHLVKMGYGALGHLLETGAMKPAEIEAVDGELLATGALLGSSGGAMRRDRLIMLATALSMAEGRTQDIDGTAIPGAGKLLVAATWKGYDRLARDAEVALDTADREARSARIEAIDAEFPKTRNPFVGLGMPPLGGMANADDRTLALGRLTRAAASVARFKAERGAFPAALADAMAEPPADPFAKGPLRYGRSPDGARAKVWSVGPDLKDDGGAPSDDKSREGDLVIGLGGGASGGG